LPPRVSRTIAGAEVGMAYLAECVGSWRRAGFEVVSLNGASEIDAVRQGHQIECLRVAGERPSIQDFISVVRASQARIAGIINADVLLFADPGLLKVVVAKEDGMTLIERINVDAASLRPTGQSCSGFDVFIFATAPLSRMDPSEEFLFGHPWWDYWFPLAYVAAGGALRKIDAPALFHLQHEQKWRPEHFIANGRKIIRCLLRSQGSLPDDVFAEIRKFSGIGDIGEAELERFGTWCFAKLRAIAEPIELSRLANSSSLLTEFVTLLEDPEKRALMGELNGAEGRVLLAGELVGVVEQVWRWVGGRPARSGEEAPRLARFAASALASRKGTLLHFWRLNIRSFQRLARRWPQSLSRREMPPKPRN
jgi:hypothetical protein